MCSIQKGQVMTITDLKARRGNFQSVYQGPALIIDAMTNNPGAAGGALIDLEGHLVGILGKELRDTAANIWINYAIPVAQFSGSVNSILQGKVVARTTQTRKGADRPVSLELLGIALIPNVLPKTPAYIDVIEPASRAARAGLQADDLVLLVNTQRVGSQIALKEELQFIDRADPVTLLVQRGSELREVVIRP
jgi:serine protease Do